MSVRIPQWLTDLESEADARLSALPPTHQPAWFQEFDDDRTGRVHPCRTCGQAPPDEP